MSTRVPLLCVQQLDTDSAPPSPVLVLNTVSPPTHSWLSMVTLFTWQHVHEVQPDDVEQLLDEHDIFFCKENQGRRNSKVRFHLTKPTCSHVL